MDSSVSPTHGNQEGSAYNGHFERMFQMAEVAVPRELFAAILVRIRRLGVPPPLVQRE